MVIPVFDSYEKTNVVEWDELAISTGRIINVDRCCDDILNSLTSVEFKIMPFKKTIELAYWCVDNLEGKFVAWQMSNIIKWYFENENEAIMFKLKWA